MADARPPIFVKPFRVADEKMSRSAAFLDVRVAEENRRVAVKLSRYLLC